MKKVIIPFLAVLLITSVATAVDFKPTLLKLSADPVIQYDFDASTLEIPIVVSGTTAGVIFSVFTKDMADNIPEMINGYLGWHHVNKVDTCIYFSTLKSMNIGANTISWNGKDQDEAAVPAGEYTYYLWAFDNQGTKEKMTHFGTARSYFYEFQEIDESGLPMANPIYYELGKRWVIGSDPMDSTFVETTTVNFA